MAHTAPFVPRHIGPIGHDRTEMLHYLGFDSAEELAQAALPESIAQKEPLGLPEALTEEGVLAALREFAAKNVVNKQMIGAGYYDTITPAVIRRNVVENPAWYTAYTPYQPEISQGRLEALLNFQTAIQDLTGLPVAGASLLDEATAVAEAVQLMARGNAKAFAHGGVVLLDSALHQQCIGVTLARAEAAGIPVEVVELEGSYDYTQHATVVGVVIANPGTTGRVRDLTQLILEAHSAGALVTVDCDPLAQVLLASPGSLGADVAVGSAQRFGVPLFFGGPHAAFMACTHALERKMPGRIVGVSQDADGTPAYRLALQTREQHIRREKATSNICTAQALLAMMAGFYAVWHGPAGLRGIATQIHGRAAALAIALASAGVRLVHDTFFDTVTVHVGGAHRVLEEAERAGFNLRRYGSGTLRSRATDGGQDDGAEEAGAGGHREGSADSHEGSEEYIGISVGESTTDDDIAQLVRIITGTTPTITTAHFDPTDGPLAEAGVLREDAILTHPIFHTITSETQMMRYLRTLADRDLALDRTMIPLGSCTMKLNAAVAMEPITWPQFAHIHPHVPPHQAHGWLELIADLEHRLEKITGYARVSVQPNAGSQGEFAGLLAIRRYHQSRGESQRDIVLIPASAHGTNAASAALAGLKVIAVKNAADGSVDLEDLATTLATYGQRTAAMMITYPSTHGVFEQHVRQVCDKVHAAGGQVYIDGANLNALVGLAQPGEFGGDVSHLNLHKTFTIPHGGGGPGVGPVCVAEHLAPFLPSDPSQAPKPSAHAEGGQPVSGAEFGSAGVLPIAWAYIALMGDEGLTQATHMALVNANYIARKLEGYYPTLYKGDTGLVAHECILDLRELTKKSGITAADVSKRLMDYGFHAPTLAFPVPGTLMVEPTESEDKKELDRFIEAMVSIHGEIQEVIDGAVAAEDSVIRHAPFTAHSLASDEFDHAHYTREQAVFPVPGLLRSKYFPPVRRIDDAYGDRNLMCSCPPLDAFDHR